MIIFKDIQELEEHLEPLSYEEFWLQIDPNGLDVDYRAHCDQEIANGVDKDTVLTCIKAAKRLEIIRAQRLEYRVEMEEFLLH
ncbi:hypothetical protein [Maritalea sp.]|uniref:hypothetical protein n=1 Tax=Maritalea sp. TaxID=2003361 RepID=UPI003EF1E50D